MNRKQTFGIMWIIALVSCFGLLFSSCKTPLSESDVPEEEWTVSNVWYYQPTGRISIRIDGQEAVFNGFSYYKDFDLSELVNWSEIIELPSVISVTDLIASGGYIQGYDNNTPVIPVGTEITFSDAWFYKVEFDALVNPTVCAKVRIATRSIPITIVE